MLADFEQSLATIYAWDEDAIWKEAATAAAKVVADSQEKIDKRCKQLGIPARFAPALTLEWSGRGENALRSRRVELKAVAATKSPR